MELCKHANEAMLEHLTAGAASFRSSVEGGASSFVGELDRGAKSIDVKLAPANGKMQLVFGDCILDVGDLPGDAAAMKPGLLAAVPDATPPDEPKVKKGKAVPTPAASEPATVRGSAPPPPREP